MKKLTTVLLAAGLLVSASACSATKLTTAETCDRVKNVVSSSAAGSEKYAMIRLGNQIRPIEAVSSDELQPVLQAILDFTDETAKEHPDTAKLQELQAEYQKAGTTFGQLCS